MLKLECHIHPEALMVPERDIHFYQVNKLISLDGCTIVKVDTGERELTSQRERARQREVAMRRKRRGRKE